MASADYSLDLMGPEVMADPAGAYEQLYAGAAVHHYKNFRPAFFIAYRYRVIETILRDPSLFLSGQGRHALSRMTEWLAKVDF
ncbi:MAG: hypothetical protein VW840_20035 [Gammaproteobacteria bacterium]